MDDLADALLFLLQKFDADAATYPLVNVGTGEDMTIAELAEAVRVVVGYGGEIRCNAAMPDGAPRKLLDVSRSRALGWHATTRLQEGLARTYDLYRANTAARGVR